MLKKSLIFPEKNGKKGKMLNEQGYTHGNIQIATSEIQGHYHAI